MKKPERLYFRYGTMGSSKTANALMVAYNYKERGQKPLLLKPRRDTRDGERIIRTRLGIDAQCEYVEEYINPDGTLVTLAADIISASYDCIIVDEAQFLTPATIDALASIADAGTPVICYGLRTDFTGHAFPGSRRLLEISDEIEEIKNICWCGRKATYNARVDSGHVVREGEQVVLGGNDKYVALCRKHFLSGELEG